MLAAVLLAFGLREEDCAIAPFGSGLINHTWLVQCGQQRFILQCINTSVFKQPFAIAHNIDVIGQYLQHTAPHYYFVQPLKTTTGALLFESDDGTFRLMPFVEGSHTVDVVHNKNEAYEAAKQFGKFTKTLHEFDTTKLKTTLPHFHDLPLRYNQFLEAMEKSSAERQTKAAFVCRFLQQQQQLVTRYQEIVQDPTFKIRVTHHDTKISNVLFNEGGAGICVIDLDTVMPGYFISDVGDMMRTYLAPVSEEEQNVDLITVRDEYFMAIVNGYRSEMNDELTETEKGCFVYAGTFMIYMQALRFVTDYLNNDVYYGQKYEGHNLARAQNQATLLQKLLDKEAVLQARIKQLEPIIPRFLK